MEYDKKFGNINLYLWQATRNVSIEMARDCSREEFDDEGYYLMGILTRMRNYLLRRLSKSGEKPVLTRKALTDSLVRRGIDFFTNTYTDSGEETRSVYIDGNEIGFVSPDWALEYIVLKNGPGMHPRSCSRISGDDMIDLLKVMDSLMDRMSELAHEAYTARLSKSKANRIRRISARHRRMQGKDILNQESDEQNT